MFLRQAWRSFLSEDDTAWIDHQIASSKRNSNSPGAAPGPSLERCLENGCSREDLLEIARTAQWQLLHAMCYLLSDPSIEEPELRHIAWALVEVRLHLIDDANGTDPAKYSGNTRINSPRFRGPRTSPEGSRAIPIPPMRARNCASGSASSLGRVGRGGSGNTLNHRTNAAAGQCPF
jgi:hypothetical protein